MTTLRDQLAETIAEVTNLKVLEVYREADELAEARKLDDQLNDLGQQIIEAMGLLLILHFGGADEIRRQSNIPEGEAAAGEADDPPAEKPEPLTPEADGAPAGSGAPATESTETTEPVCVDCGGPRASGSSERCRQCYRARAEAKKPADKMSEKRPGKERKRHPLAVELEAWLKENGLTAGRFAHLVGITDQTIRNLLSGATAQPSPKVEKAVRKGIRRKKPNTKQPDKAAPKTANGGDQPSEQRPGRSAIQFLQLHVEKFMKSEDLSQEEVAEVFGIPEAAVRGLFGSGALPCSDFIARIGDHTPEVQANIDPLFKARQLQHNERARA